MKVKDLIEKLEEYGDDLDVAILVDGEDYELLSVEDATVAGGYPVVELVKGPGMAVPS